MEIKNTSSTTKAYFYLIGGVLCLSISPLFFRWIDADGVMISFYRMLFVSVFFAPFILFQKNKETSKKPSAPAIFLLFLFPILSGISTAFDLSIWSVSIKYTSVANAIVLNYTSPVWVALFGIVFLKEKHRNIFWIGLVFVIIGAFLISNPDFSSGKLGKGEVLALISSFFYASYFLVTQKSRKNLSALKHTCLSAISSMFVLALIGIIFQMNFFHYPTKTWVGFILAGLISQFGGYFFMSQAMGTLPASIVSPFMVLQPVLSALLAVPFAGEPLSFNQIYSGIIIILGVWFVTISTRKKEKNTFTELT